MTFMVGTSSNKEYEELSGKADSLFDLSEKAAKSMDSDISNINNLAGVTANNYDNLLEKYTSTVDNYMVNLEDSEEAFNVMTAEFLDPSKIDLKSVYGANAAEKMNATYQQLLQSDSRFGTNEGGMRDFRAKTAGLIAAGEQKGILDTIGVQRDMVKDRFEYNKGFRGMELDGAKAYKDGGTLIRDKANSVGDLYKTSAGIKSDQSGVYSGLSEDMRDASFKSAENIAAARTSNSNRQFINEELNKFDKETGVKSRNAGLPAYLQNADSWGKQYSDQDYRASLVEAKLNS